MTDRGASPGARLVLGTAQLGMVYGVMNAAGRPSAAEAHKVLDLAYAHGVRALDTAPGYGASEAVIGGWVGDRAVELVTKLPADVDPSDGPAVRAAVLRSTERLGRPPAALLAHDPDAVHGWAAAGGAPPALRAVRDEGLVGALGLSLYGPAELELALGIDDVTTVQVPASVFDRRLVDSGLLTRAVERGLAVSVRSVFLQGLALADPAAVPPFARAAVAAFRAACGRWGVAPATAALGYVLDAAPAARLVVGAETAAQLAATMAAWPNGALPRDLVDELARLPVDDVLIDPRRWPR